MGHLAMSGDIYGEKHPAGIRWGSPRVLLTILIMSTANKCPSQDVSGAGVGTHSSEVWWW